MGWGEIAAHHQPWRASVRPLWIFLDMTLLQSHSVPSQHRSGADDGL